MIGDIQKLLLIEKHQFQDSYVITGRIRMEISIETLDDYGFLSCLLGGVLAVVMSLLSFIISVADAKISWFFGGGFIGIANVTAGSIISMIFGGVAIVIGLKLFSSKINDLIDRMERIVVAIIMIVISVIIFGIGGILILIGGILVLIHRLRKDRI